MRQHNSSRQNKKIIPPLFKSPRIFSSSFFPFLISLIADGPHHYHPACGHKESSISPRFTPYNFLSRCKFSTLTTRQPMVEFYLLTFPRFPLRKKEHKSYFGKNRTHDFRTSRCAAYLLDHSGEGYNIRLQKPSCPDDRIRVVFPICVQHNPRHHRTYAKFHVGIGIKSGGQT